MQKEIIVRMHRGEDKQYSFTNDNNGNPINFANYTITVECYLYRNSEVYALGDPTQGYGPDISPKFAISTDNTTCTITFGYLDFTGLREMEVYWKVIGTNSGLGLKTILLDGYVQLMD